MLRLMWPWKKILKMNNLFSYWFCGVSNEINVVVIICFFNWSSSVLVFSYRITGCSIVKNIDYLPSMFWNLIILSFSRFLWRYFLVESLIVISLEENISSVFLSRSLNLNTFGTSIICSYILSQFLWMLLTPRFYKY